MSSFKILKTRIQKIRSIQKVTKAMEIIATIRFKHFRGRKEAFAPYAEHMEEIIKVLTAASDNYLINTTKQNVHLIIIITSNRGLCGKFNDKLLYALSKMVESFEQEGDNIKIACIGKKGHKILKKIYNNIDIEYYGDFGDKSLKMTDVLPIAQNIINLINDCEIKACHILFTKFQSLFALYIMQKQLFPCDNITFKEDPYYSCEFEPSPEEILSIFLQKYIAAQVYYALLESVCSEQAARLQVVSKANNNSKKLIQQLTLLCNKARQTRINKELLEIVIGTEALADK